MILVRQSLKQSSADNGSDEWRVTRKDVASHLPAKNAKGCEEIRIYFDETLS